MVFILSIPVVFNLFSTKQLMNASFDPLHLVNTYGAFGSVGKQRFEIVLEGTSDHELTNDTKWLEFEFNCKPGSLSRRPCIVAPYNYRLDWQIWFAAMSTFERNPWLVHLVAKLLANDQLTKQLLAEGPFANEPPVYIRGVLYRYKFASSSITDNSPANWWVRERVGQYFPPISKKSEALIGYLRTRGWQN